MISSHRSVASQSPEATPAELPEWLPAAAGAALAVVALSKKRSLLGFGVMAGAGYLLYRAAKNGDLQIPSDLLDRFKSQLGNMPESIGGYLGADSKDRVDEASWESFPASDPPATY